MLQHDRLCNPEYQKQHSLMILIRNLPIKGPLITLTSPLLKKRRETGHQQHPTNHEAINSEDQQTFKCTRKSDKMQQPSVAKSTGSRKK